MDLSLRTAIDAIDRGELEDALSYAIDAWAAQPNAATARLIDLLDHCLLGFSSPGVPPTSDELIHANLVERGGMLRRLRAHPADSAAADVWCDALLALSPDPRVSLLLQTYSHQFRIVWTRPEADLDDPELDLEDPLTARFHAVCVHHTAEVIGIAVERPDDELDGPDERALLDVELALRRRLFDDAGDREAIAPFVDPTDRTTLTAYADWLTARGDPRGALLAWGAPAKPRDLYVTRDLWLGPIGRVAYASIDDGWVRLVRFHHGEADALGHCDWRALEIGWRPGWIAVEQLENPPAQLLKAVPLPALRVLACDRTHLLDALDAGVDLVDLDVLALNRWYGSQIPSRADAEATQRILRAPNLHGLRDLELHAYAENRSLVDAVIAAMTPLLADPCGVPSLTVSWSAREWMWMPAPQWIRALRAARSPLRRFRGSADAGERWILGHVTDGVDWTAVRVEWWGSSPNIFAADRVCDVARAGVERITVVAKQALPAEVEGRLHTADAEITVEIDPALTLDRVAS